MGWTKVTDALPEINEKSGYSNECIISVQDMEYEPEMEETHGSAFGEFSVTGGHLMRLSTGVLVWVNNSGYPIEEFEFKINAWRYMVEPYKG